ncbi:hypothetical protein FRC98_18175 [Lujinxingia vulgaris]|uniref:Uncharacterized protein n=1 Tax=Lujinxingia vulgaris TaxID=2600176 RepID=A0A5C6X3B3_9DELT|nr:hypothetical protein [Lujinxingia vulgaris]TXD34760.1 hypothetical protein FRC98_18175 [Lujinxingia vulgaris]
MACDDPAEGSRGNAARALVPYERPAAGVSPGGTLSGESAPGSELCLANFDYQSNGWWRGDFQVAGFSSGPDQTFRDAKRVLASAFDEPEIVVNLEPIATLLEDRHAQLAQDGERDIVWMVQAIPHLHRSTHPYGPTRDGDTLTYAPESICGLPVEQRPASAGEFAQRCGSARVKLEVLGHVYVFIADITDLNGDERAELRNVLPFNVLTGPGDEPALNWINSLTESTYAQLGWQLYPLGVESFEEFFTPLAWQSFDWSTFRERSNTIHERLFEHRADNEYEHPAFGIPYAFTTEPYNSVELTYCHADAFEDELECLHEFETRRASFISPSSDLKIWHDHLRWVLANPARVIWQSNTSDRQAPLQSWVDEVQLCIDTLHQNAASCATAVDAQARGDDTAPLLCDACTLPADCDPEALLAELDDLRLPYNDDSQEMFLHPRRFEPLFHDAEQNKSGGVRGAEDWLCTLNSISGYFAGGAESVMLSREVDTTVGRSYWHLDFDSGRAHAATGERLRAGVSCIPRALFGDASFELENDAFTDLSTSARTTTEVVGTRRQLHALAGIGGRLGGLQTFAQTALEPSSDDALATIASTDELRARVLSFGSVEDGAEDGGALRLISPASEFTLQNPPAEPGEASTETTRILARLDEAYCYLTEISGQFDGRTELVDLNATYDHWQLRVRAAAGKQVRASARCVTYDPSAVRDP